MPNSEDQIFLQFNWEGGAAKIVEIYDNGHPIDVPSNNAGNGEIVVSYKTKASSFHFVRATLWFPEAKLTKLTVKAARNDGSVEKRTSVAKEEEREHYWTVRAEVT